MGPELCRVTVPWDPNRLNPNRVSRCHWSVPAQRRTGAREAALIGYRQAGCPEINEPVDVLVTVRRGRALDDDNVWAALKAVRDVLFNRALTPSDAPRWVRYLPLVQESAAKWKGREEVLFVVYAREVRG